MKKLIYGVGINDADYTVDTNSGGKRKKCKAYTAWTSMLCRCYSDKYQQQFPSYKGCSVCDEWRLFSNFKKWFYAQPGNETYVLDKDLLVAENKIYSPETCLLIPVKVNSFLTERNAGRGKYPIGVHKRTGKEIFIATCGSDLASTGKYKRKYIGQFNTPEEAHQAYLSEKFKQAELMAKNISNPKIANALINRFRQEKNHV